LKKIVTKKQQISRKIVKISLNDNTK
jgi:hypothetical protein